MTKILRLAITAASLAILSGCGDPPPPPGFECRYGADYLAQERQFQICIMRRPETADASWIQQCEKSAKRIAHRRICIQESPLQPIEKLTLGKD